MHDSPMLDQWATLTCLSTMITWSPASLLFRSCDQWLTQWLGSLPTPKYCLILTMGTQQSIREKGFQNKRLIAMLILPRGLPSLGRDPRQIPLYSHHWLLGSVSVRTAFPCQLSTISLPLPQESYCLSSHKPFVISFWASLFSCVFKLGSLPWQIGPVSLRGGWRWVM